MKMNKYVLILLSSLLITSCSDDPLNSSVSTSSEQGTSTSSEQGTSISEPSETKEDPKGEEDPRFESHIATRGWPTIAVANYLKTKEVTEVVAAYEKDDNFYSRVNNEDGEFYEIFLVDEDNEKAFTKVEEYVGIARSLDWFIDDSISHYGVYELISPSSQIKMQVSVFYEHEVYPVSVYWTIEALNYDALKGLDKVQGWPNTQIGALLSAYNRTNTVPAVELDRTFYYKDMNTYLAVALPTSSSLVISEYVATLTSLNWKIEEKDKVFSAEDSEKQALITFTYKISERLAIWNIYPFISVPTGGTWPTNIISEFLTKHGITTNDVPAYKDLNYAYQIEDEFGDWGTYIAVETYSDTNANKLAYEEIIGKSPLWTYLYDKETTINMGPIGTVVNHSKVYVNKDETVVLEVMFDEVAYLTCWYITIASTIDYKN